MGILELIWAFNVVKLIVEIVTRVIVGLYSIQYAENSSQYAENNSQYEENRTQYAKYSSQCAVSITVSCR